MKLRTVPAVLVATVFAVGCADGPLGPTVADSLSAGPSEARIGPSPLIILEPATKTLDVAVEVTKGIVNAAGHNDRFWLRTTVSFQRDEEDEMGTVTSIDKPKAAGEEKIRSSSLVPVTVVLQIDDDTWTKLVNAADAGAQIGANVTVVLLLIDGAGGEHVLDKVASSGVIDPKDGT